MMGKEKNMEANSLSDNKLISDVAGLRQQLRSFLIVLIVTLPVIYIFIIPLLIKSAAQLIESDVLIPKFFLQLELSVNLFLIIFFVFYFIKTIFSVKRITNTSNMSLKSYALLLFVIAGVGISTALWFWIGPSFAQTKFVGVLESIRNWHLNHYLRNTIRIIIILLGGTVILIKSVFLKYDNRIPTFNVLALLKIVSLIAVTLFPTWILIILFWGIAEISIKSGVLEEDQNSSLESFPVFDDNLPSLWERVNQYTEIAPETVNNNTDFPHRPFLNMEPAQHQLINIFDKMNKEQLEDEFDIDKYPLKKSLIKYLPDEFSTSLRTGIEFVLDLLCERPEPKSGHTKMKSSEQFLEVLRAVIALVNQIWYHSCQIERGKKQGTETFNPGSYKSIPFKDEYLEKLKENPILLSVPYFPIEPQPGGLTINEVSLCDYILFYGYWSRRWLAEPTRVAVSIYNGLRREENYPFDFKYMKCKSLIDLWADGWLTGERTVGYLNYIALRPKDMTEKQWREIAGKLREDAQNQLSEIREESKSLEEWLNRIMKLLPIYWCCHHFYDSLSDPEERDREQRFVEELTVDIDDVWSAVENGTEWFWCVNITQPILDGSGPKDAVRMVDFKYNGRISYPRYVRDKLVEYVGEKYEYTKKEFKKTPLWCPEEFKEPIVDKWKMDQIRSKMKSLIDPSFVVLRQLFTEEMRK